MTHSPRASSYAEILNPTRDRDNSDGDLLQLNNGDILSNSLVSTQFTGNNYLIWSRAIKIALGAKDKLGFITGETPMPIINSPEYKMWKNVIAWYFHGF